MRDYITRLLIPSMERFHGSVRADLARLVLGEARRFPALGKFYKEKIFLPWNAHFEMLLQRAIDEGELHGILPSTGAMLLGAPFWVYLANDSIQGSIKAGCTLADLSRAQIEALFGRFGPHSKS